VIDDLPSEIINYIISFLDRHSISRLCKTNHSMNGYCSEHLEKSKKALKICAKMMKDRYSNYVDLTGKGRKGHLISIDHLLRNLKAFDGKTLQLVFKNEVRRGLPLDISGISTCNKRFIVKLMFTYSEPLCIIYDVIEILNRIIESPDNDMYEWSIIKKYVSKLNYNFIPGSLRVINE